MDERASRQQVLEEILALINTLVGDRLSEVERLAASDAVAQWLDEAAPDWRENTHDAQWLVAEVVARAEASGQVYLLLETVRSAFPASDSECAALHERYWQTVVLHAPPFESMTDLPKIEIPSDPNMTGWPSLPVSETASDLEDFFPEQPEEVIDGDQPESDPGASRDSDKTQAAPRIETLRLDTAVPEQVIVGQAFKLAVAIRRTTSPQLEIAGLPQVESGEIVVLASAGDPFLRLRVEVSAPDCIIAGESDKRVRLLAGQDSGVFLFHLTPKRHGPISIFVTVYQEEDCLGTAGVNTTAQEASTRVVAGEVQVNLQSQPLGELFPAANAIQPIYRIALEVVADDPQTPLLIAQQTGMDLAQIAHVSKPADQWWIVLIAAHEAQTVHAIGEVIAGRFPNRADEIAQALALYDQAILPTP